MKIAICSDYFYPKIGGITTHIEDLAKNLEKRGHSVIIITKKAKFDDRSHGLNVIRINSFFRTSNTIDIPQLTELKNAIKKVKPDIIHTHHAFSPISLFSLAIGKKLKIKRILTNHSIQFLYDFDYLWKPSSYLLFPYKQYINDANKIIAVSSAAATFISHFTNKEIEVIPNGIDVKSFAPKTKKFSGKNILFVGRFSYRKGLHLLLESMGFIIKENKEIKLTIVGKGYMKSILKLLIRTLNLQKNVVIKENLNKEELISLYKKSDVFVMPSIFGESFGIVLLEAMASKTPIVATKQGGIKEIIVHNRTGLLIERNRPKKFAESIMNLLNNKKLSKKLSSNAYNEVKKYDWNNIIKKIENIYEDA